MNQLDASFHIKGGECIPWGTSRRTGKAKVVETRDAANASAMFFGVNMLK